MPAWVPTHRALEWSPELGLQEVLPPAALRPAPARAWFVCDVLGIVCATSTWLLVLGTAWVLLQDLRLQAPGLAYSVAHGALFYLLAALGLVAHARTMFTDPGSVPPGEAPGPDAKAHCSCCGSAKPARAHHCSVCRRCIRKMDHHCPWVNNCVGEANQKHFVLFTLYIGLASLYLLLLLGTPALHSYVRGEWDLNSTVSPRGSVIFLVLVALKGFLLTSVMFTAQMYAICTDRTRIEQLQKERGAQGKGSSWANLKGVFGHQVSVAWINPFAPAEPQRARGHHDMV